MMEQKLGKIKEIDIKEVFSKENDFTSWLSKKLNILGEKLGLDISDGRIEEGVGNFKCDITAKGSHLDKIIIIENQFGKTNHDHLGKILTYAAGKNANIVIWIAESFREEHKKALEWLNENVDPKSGVSFFGVEVKLIKIEGLKGESDPAIDFRIVVRPNDWERMIKASTGLDETSRKYLEFFSKLVDAYSEINPKWRKVKPQPQSWLSFGAGKSGLGFGWAFRSNNRIAVELYIDTGNKNKNERIFEELKKYKEQIETEIKGLTWEKLEEKRACRIAIYKNIGTNIKSLTEEECREIIKWAAETMKLFSSVFSKYIEKL